MLDYVGQRPLPNISTVLQFFGKISFIFIFLQLSCFGLYGIHSQSIEKASLHKILKLRHTPQTKRLLRIIYFREFDMTIDENRLKIDSKNLTDAYSIDLKVSILDQTKSLLVTKLCSLISEEQRDTIIIADLYTKEIDFISRSLRIPTIAITNRYQIVQGKLHNPYLFKLMSDPLEEARSLAYVLDNRSVYTRIALIYDISLDMIEYRFSYLRLAKQDIIYRAHIPRISLLFDLRRTARKIITDLTELNVDVILCAMSTERELQFLRLITEVSTFTEANILFNKTSWWFASRLGEIRNLTYIPKIYTAYEDRRRLLAHFSSLNRNILLNAILRTYVRLPSLSVFIGTTNCALQQTIHQLRKTHMFIKLLSNFTEWNCDIRMGPGTGLILFEPKTLAWRVPTIFTVHTEHFCRGILSHTLHLANTNSDQLFRSCQFNSSGRKNSPSSEQMTTSSNALVDIRTYHQVFDKLMSDQKHDCRFVRMRTPLQRPIIVGVVEPPYIFVSDAQISSEFHCSYGLPCYQIDPLLYNSTTDVLFFHTKITTPPHCCYGISVNLLLRLEDSKILTGSQIKKLFVFADKPNKWLALVQTLKYRRAHLSISAIPYESFLAYSIDLTSPFYHSSYVILTAPPPTEPSLGAFLQPFSWATWGLIFIILTATAAFETFFEWHSPYGLTPKGRRRQKVFSLASALTLSWSIVFSHTFKTKSPKCWSNRFLGNVWGGFGIVFIAIYTAKLASFMVETDRIHIESNAHNISDVCRNMPRCTIGIVANTSDEEYLKRFYGNSLYRHIEYVPSYSHGIDSLRKRVIDYLLMDHSMARYYLTRDGSKLIRIDGDNFGTFGLSLGFSKFNTELKDNITQMLLSYVDKGIIQRLHDEWYVYENCEKKILSEDRVLYLDRFFGVFILLITGMLVGLITLLLEWFTFKYAVPHWRRHQWLGWLFCSQRLYAVLNASTYDYNQAYSSWNNNASISIGERLHNHSIRRDSIDLHVINVPKLLSTNYQLKEQSMTVSPPNGDLKLKRENVDGKQLIRRRIHELEQELDCLRSQLIPISTAKDS